MIPNEACHCPRVKHYHGARNNYLTHACRCQPCTADATRERDLTRRLQAYGRYDRAKLPAQPTRDHINHLIRNGMNVTSVARNAGIPHQTLSRILGTGKETPAEHVSAKTAAAIRAVTANQPKARLMDALGTQRRIQALACAGYTFAHQARLAGIHPDAPRHVLTRPKVTASTAQAIAELFTRLQLQPNLPRTRTANQATNTAKRNGWLPAFCWDYERIDDPTHLGYPKEVAA